MLQRCNKGILKMENSLFENELRNLSLMAESWQSDTLFIQEYENLLGQVRKGTDQDVKYGQLLRMKKLALLQTAFLMRAYLREQRVQMHEIY